MPMYTSKISSVSVWKIFYSHTANKVRHWSLLIIVASVCVTMVCVWHVFSHRVRTVELAEPMDTKDRSSVNHIDNNSNTRKSHIRRKFSLNRHRAHGTPLFTPVNKTWPILELPKRPSFKGFTECEMESGWPQIQAMLQPVRVVIDKHKIQQIHGIRPRLKNQQQRPLSEMVCWDGKYPKQQKKGALKRDHQLCVIRNLYAEMDRRTGTVRWRLIKNELHSRKGEKESLRINLLKGPAKSERTWDIHLGIETRDDFEDVSIEDSLAISSHRWSVNQWVAMSDLSAHWLTLRLLPELLDKQSTMSKESIIGSHTRWTLICTDNGGFSHRSIMSDLYTRLWDSVVFDQGIDSFIRSRVGWTNHSSDFQSDYKNESEYSKMLVRIPLVLLPLNHWAGLLWRRAYYPCPLMRPHLNPVFLEWQNITDVWMTEMWNNQGPSLLDEVCHSRMIRRVRMFPRNPTRPTNLRRGFLLKSSNCRYFWRKLMKRGKEKLLVFADRHLNGLFTSEPCSSTPCIFNLNHTRNTLLRSPVMKEFHIVMINPNQLSLRSQYELLSLTSLLFGMQSEIFGFAQFLPSNAMVYELQPKRKIYPQIRTVCGSLGIRFGRFKCHSRDNHGGYTVPSEMAVDNLITSLVLGTAIDMT